MTAVPYLTDFKIPSFDYKTCKPDSRTQHRRSTRRQVRPRVQNTAFSELASSLRPNLILDYYSMFPSVAASSHLLLFPKSMSLLTTTNTKPQRPTP